MSRRLTPAWPVAEGQLVIPGFPERRAGGRHRWRKAIPGELVEYGSASEPHRCDGCGIFRFTRGVGREKVTLYQRMTMRGGRSEVVHSWARSPACPPIDEPA